jgi:hypothetical protein
MIMYLFDTDTIIYWLNGNQGHWDRSMRSLNFQVIQVINLAQNK